MKALATKAGMARDLTPSSVIEGKYRLERVLGAGAMGRVWLARNVHLDAPVAIKVVEREIHGSEAMQRVLTEARMEARLRHPNIVRVLDCHAVADMSYVVMELLEGCTLADLMDEGPLPPSLAVRLLLPLIEGLAAAHRAGIVHRDIKPENLFIARVGERICPKLLDFGIAHVPSDPSSKKRRQIVGTPGYMSPEQAYGEAEVDARSDIWSLGIVLYEAVSGESAFGCSDYRDYLRALNERELPPLPDSSGCAELWRIIQRALCPSAIGRFTSCEELSSALQGWLRSRGVHEDLTRDSLSPAWAMSGSIIDRAMRRAAVKHAAFGERDSYAPTQPDLTTRRRGERSQRATPPGTSAPSHVTTRAPSDGAVADANRASTIRTIPKLAAAGKRQRWSAYALLAGAAFGVSYALIDVRGQAQAERGPSSEATLQPTAAGTLDAPPRGAHAPPPALRVITPEPDADRADDSADRGPSETKPQHVSTARPKPNRPTAREASLRKRASALGLKSPW